MSGTPPKPKTDRPVWMPPQTCNKILDLFDESVENAKSQQFNEDQEYGDGEDRMHARRIVRDRKKIAKALERFVVDLAGLEQRRGIERRRTMARMAEASDEKKA